MRVSVRIVKVAAECELSGPTEFDPYPGRQQCLTIAQRRQHIAFSLGGAIGVRAIFCQGGR